MHMRPLLLSTLVFVAPLTACAGDNRGVETVHQPVVTRSQTSLDLLASADGLAGGEAQRLRAWIDGLRLAQDDVVAIDDPNGVNDGGGRVRADVAAVTGRYGLRLSHAAPAADATTAVAPGTVRIVVERTRAGVPSCDVQRSRGDLVNFDAHVSSDFGCAINGNLAAMVADPADLVRGKSDTGAPDLWAPNKALGAYRKATQTGGGGVTIKNESSGGK